MTMTIRPVGATAPQSNLVVAIDGSGGRERVLKPEQVAASSDKTLKETVANASSVMDFLSTRFQRDGLDGGGKKLELVVHAPDPETGGRMDNAYWNGQTGKMYVGDGSGTMFAPLGKAKDILAHEAGHAVLESEIKMGFAGQEGALHESFGDVIGSLVDVDDWQIGEDAFTPNRPGDAIRDMSKPSAFKHMSDVRGPQANEPHLLADIPNLAAVRVAEKIGREEMGSIWYEGFTSHLKDYGKFTDAAAATLKAATLLYGEGSSQVSAVADAWTSVGVLKAPPAA